MELDGPLETGVWTTVLVYDQKPLASTEFLITPLVGDLSPDRAYTAKPNLALEETHAAYLPNDGPSLSRRQRRFALFNQSVKNNQPQAYLDGLLAEFYAVQDVCEVNSIQATLSCHWQLCSATDWSSLAPDPKSNLS